MVTFAQMLALAQEFKLEKKVCRLFSTTVRLEDEGKSSFLPSVNRSGFPFHIRIGLLMKNPSPFIHPATPSPSFLHKDQVE